MKKLFIASVLLFFVATGAHAQEVTLNPIYPVCDSLESFKEMSAAFANKDTRTAEYLVTQRRCVFLAKPTPATQLDASWTGWVKVRVWVGDTPLNLWTNYESIK